MNKTNNALTLSNLFAGYGNRIILNNISLKAEKGKIIAIMGRSGSGKTTLLKTITGQIPIKHGSIHIFDKDIGNISNKDLKDLRKNLGVLFQHGALFSDLNIFENIALPLTELSVISNRELTTIVLEKLDSVGLKAAAHLPITKISGGMAKRVALARAIILNPKLVLYDEPFSGLDPISSGIIADLIKTLSKKNECTSLLITHNVRETFKISDIVYIIDNGMIAASGTPLELVNSNNPYVQQFIQGNIDGPVAFHYPETEEYKKWLKEQEQKI
ncbi:MAG: ATP-binding cassette domain-containing protein [Candidatus Kinetoplastibacterium crithidii]|nr:ATP-binding cassette domain-containing protein [Candidatus Kinetoplastibacterium crithidii]